MAPSPARFVPTGVIVLLLALGCSDRSATTSPGASSPIAPASKGDPSRPNIVLVLADDLGYGDLACYGSRTIPTPRIDSIAQSGERFTSAYVTAPVCSPSRAGLMTGRYQERYGYEFNTGPQRPETID